MQGRDGRRHRGVAGPELPAAPRGQRGVHVHHIDRVLRVHRERMPAKGAGEGHRRLEPRNLDDADAIEGRGFP